MENELAFERDGIQFLKNNNNNKRSQSRSQALSPNFLPSLKSLSTFSIYYCHIISNVYFKIYIYLVQTKGLCKHACNAQIFFLKKSHYLRANPPCYDIFHVKKWVNYIGVHRTLCSMWPNFEYLNARQKKNMWWLTWGLISRLRMESAIHNTLYYLKFSSLFLWDNNNVSARGMNNVVYIR